MAKESLKPDDYENQDSIMARVESIVNTLEHQDTKLEDSITLFEEGMSLLHTAQDNLAKAEQRVITLSTRPEANNDESTSES